MYDTFWTRQGYRLLGVVFFVIVGLLITLSLQAYSKAFTPVVKVDLQITASGQQLLPGSDVKVRGLLVGEVRSITSDGRLATIHMALKPSEARRLPVNVSAQILPKTVFGEKYVSLIYPENPSTTMLADVKKPVIGPDRSKPALEISRVLSNTLPLLRSVKPEQLNLTLNAVASALEGRGEKLGEVFELLDSYLKGVNPHLDDLKHDLIGLADVAETYNAVAPDLLTVLRNMTVTSRTIVAKQATLADFLTDVTDASNRTRGLLQKAGNNLIQVNKVNKNLIALLARYSPIFPCFFEGYEKLGPQVQAAIGTTPETVKSAHIVIEFEATQPNYTYPLDLPAYTDDRGPNCYGLPNPPVPQPAISPALQDGTEDNPCFNPSLPDPCNVPPAASAAGPASTGGPGSARERSMVDALLAPVLQVPSHQVPDIVDLLWGPMARGHQVSLR